MLHLVVPAAVSALSACGLYISFRWTTYQKRRGDRLIDVQTWKETRRGKRFALLSVIVYRVELLAHVRLPGGSPMTNKATETGTLITLEAFKAVADTLNPEMNLYQVIMLLAIAANVGDPLSVSEVGEKADSATSTTSHNMAVLADRKRQGKPGYGLVMLREDYNNRRKKLVALTPEGIKITDEIGRRVGRKLDTLSRVK